MACALGKVAKQLGIEGKDASHASPCKLTSLLNNAVAMRKKTWKISSRHIPTPSSLLPSHLGWQNQVKSMDLMTVSLTPFFFSPRTSNLIQDDPRCCHHWLSSSPPLFHHRCPSFLIFLVRPPSPPPSPPSLPSSLPRYPPSGIFWPRKLTPADLGHQQKNQEINQLDGMNWAIHVIPPARPTAWKNL